MRLWTNYERCKKCDEPTHLAEAACLHCGVTKAWAKASPNRRIALGTTALRILAALDEHGPTPLSHGARYAEISAGRIRCMSSTNYLLRSSDMVEWAGGNYGRWHVRITDYGRECLRRRSRDPNRCVSPLDTYGPRDADAALTSQPAEEGE